MSYPPHYVWTRGWGVAYALHRARIDFLAEIEYTYIMKIHDFIAQMAPDTRALWYEERNRRAVKAMIGVPKASPVNGKVESNMRAKRWYLLSPDNVVYECINLRHFIREHENLFAVADIVWKKIKSSTPGNTWCRASQGLSAVGRGRTSVWKDWRVTHDPETITYWQAIREAERKTL